MQKVFVDECPESLTIWEWACQTTDIEEAIRDVRDERTHLVLRYNSDLYEFQKNVVNVLECYEQIPWRTSGDGLHFYKSVGLTYNPSHKEGFSATTSSIGTKETYTDSDRRINGVRKNSYDDTLSFVEVSEIGNEGCLKDFLSSISENGFTNIRSRISTLDSSIGKRANQFLWHRDESIFENLRINIPVSGYHDGVYGFEMEGTELQVMKVNSIYSWDTERLHRPVIIKPAVTPRSNIVHGISPWLRYNKSDNCWEENEYFGKVHPFDLLSGGKITNLISS